ncbi:hypothetical protein [Enterococcus crotali]|uniref:hypothetical protein n=1 Tax=Enterococcus crotali TaxID=1453587 RepID=UPI00046E8E91|nr:hypothetical protein [Enterococcus crotali]
MNKKTNSKYLKSGIILCSIALFSSIGFIDESYNVSAEESSVFSESTTADEGSTSQSEETSQSTVVSETSSSSSDSTVETSERNITEENNKELGNASKTEDGEYIFNPNDRSDLAITLRAAAEPRSLISATENNRPSKDFVDISSHNGALSVAAFNEMKNMG